MLIIFYVLFVQRDDIDFVLILVDRKIRNFRVQNGIKEYFVRLCWEIKLDYFSFESGLYCFLFVMLLVLFMFFCKVM